MAGFSSDQVSEIRDRASIQEVVGEYVALRKSGSNFQGLCPFHGEKTPSFNVNPSRNIFHCFGCGAGGDVFAFIMRIEGLTFPDAVRFLARKTGVVLREETPGDQKRASERDELLRVMEAAQSFYARRLMENPASPAAEYVRSRGLSQQIIEKYGVGFAPEGWDTLVRHLERLKLSLPQAEKLGLVRRRDTGGYYDLFRNRLLFPIQDGQGRVVAFGGRVLDGSLPKYINSPESPIYRKSEVLFGLHLAKPGMRETGTVVVVEGYFDQLSLFEAGIGNAVATCGTSLTEDHVRILKRHAERACLLFDGDAAGLKAAVRGVELFVAAGFPVSVVTLPQGDDPDTFVRKQGADTFRERLAAAQPGIFFLIREALRHSDAASVEGKIAAVKKLLPTLAKVDDAIQREKYLQEIARAVEMDPLLLRRHMDGKGSAPQQRAAAAPSRSQMRGPEEMLLALTGRFRDVAQRVRDESLAALLPSHLSSLAEELAARMVTEGQVDWPSFLAGIEPESERSRIAALVIDDRELEDVDPHKALEESVAVLQRRVLQDSQSLRRELAKTDPDSPRYWEILQRLDTLRNRKSQLS